MNDMKGEETKKELLRVTECILGFMKRSLQPLYVLPGGVAAI